MTVSDHEVKRCLNCGSHSSGDFCTYCGQKQTDNTDRSLRALVGNLLSGLFFLDGRLFSSLRYFILKPGHMPAEFLNGKRKKFIPPVSLFLFINVIYFIVNPITDYSLSLTDQIRAQPYSAWSMKLVQSRVEERNTSIEEYEALYNPASDNVSKTWMILNVPLLALFTYLVAFGKYPFYYDSLIFSLYYFGFFLLSLITGRLLLTLHFMLPDDLGINLFQVYLNVFLLIIPLAYLILSVRHWLKRNWVYSVLTSLVIFFGLMIEQFAYRFFVFGVTFLLT